MQVHGFGWMGHCESADTLNVAGNAVEKFINIKGIHVYAEQLLGKALNENETYLLDGPIGRA